MCQLRTGGLGLPACVISRVELDCCRGSAGGVSTDSCASGEARKSLEATCLERVNVLTRLEVFRNRVLPLLSAVLMVLLLVWIVLAPPESRLGNLVKLVFVHGALVWSGLLSFTVAGMLGLVSSAAHHLLGSLAPAAQRRATAWYRGTEAAGLAALIIWVATVFSSMAVTGLTWGQIIAWNEPRVQATGLILLAALVLLIVARLVANPDFTAIVSVLMGIVPWILVQRAGVIRHPVDPIGGSESEAIQYFYLLILLTIAGLALTLIAWLWTGAELRAVSPPERQKG
jgi:hypothetical protein